MLVGESSSPSPVIHDSSVRKPAQTSFITVRERRQLCWDSSQSLKSLLCLINLSRHCAWIVTNYMKNLCCTWTLRKVKTHLILLWVFLLLKVTVFFSIGFVVPRVLQNRIGRILFNFYKFCVRIIWSNDLLVLPVCSATFSCASVWNRSWESLRKKGVRTFLSAFVNLDEKN